MIQVQHQELAWTAADGLPLFAQCWRPEDEPAAVVCVVHGAGEHSGRYMHVADALTQARFAVLALDLRGHGRSGGLRGHTPSYEALLQDLDLLLAEAAQRFPGVPLFLYGHSLGGGLVLYYTLRRRPAVAGVVATSPWLRLAFTPPPWKETLAMLLSRAWPSFPQATGLETDALSHDPAVARAYTTDPLVHNRATSRMYVSCRAAGRWSLAHAAEFPVPLLLMHGTADRITSHEASAAFAAQLPGACELRLWPGAYHELHNEPQRQEVLDAIVAWLQAHLS